MRFDYYAGEPVTYAVHLVNTRDSTSDRDDLRTLPDLQRFVTEVGIQVAPEAHDLRVVRNLRDDLRAIFATDDLGLGMGLVNRLLVQFNSAPRLVNDAELGIHIHFEPVHLSLGHWLGAITAAGLMFHVCDQGLDRLGICASDKCKRAFIDTTKNGRKFYCSPRCSHRASVEAFRLRQNEGNSSRGHQHQPRA